jgi:hypothetical protein
LSIRGLRPRRDHGATEIDRSPVNGRKRFRYLQDRISASEIARVTHFHPSAMKRYLAVEAVRNFMGAEGQPPTYPAESLPLFRSLKDLHDAGKIAPSTFDALKDILFTSSTSPDRRPNSDQNPGSPQSGLPIGPLTGLRTLVPSAQVPAGPDAAAEFQAAVQRGVLEGMRQFHAETAGNAVLSVQEAAVLLACRPEQVSRHIKSIPGRRGKYHASAVQAKIREWGQEQ